MRQAVVALGAIALFALLGLGGGYLARRKPKPPPLPLPVVSEYPKRAVYAAMGSNGGQFVRNGVVDTAVCQRFALHDYIIIEAHRTRAPNAAALRYIRQLNPRASMLAFVKSGKYFVCGLGWAGQTPPPYGCDTTGMHQSWSRWVVIRAHDAVLWSTSGQPYLGGGYLNWARPGFATALADTDAAWVPDYFSGIFCDEQCTSWLPGGDTVDHMRAGYATRAEWERAQWAGVQAYFARLRERLGSKLIVGNCGPHGSRTANGWMIEDWQNGHDVASYLARETTYTAPRQNWRTIWMHNPPTANDYRWARYAIGVASLGEGVATPTWSSGDAARGWFDGLDLGADWRDWGRATGVATRMQDGIWQRSFDHGVLTVNERLLTSSFVRR